MPDDARPQTGGLLKHYKDLLATHGTSTAALGWRDADVQRRNFAAVSQIFHHESGPFTLHEVGCGLGHYADFLAEYFPNAIYSGSDIVPEMVERTHHRRPGLSVEVRDVISAPPPQADYVVESGIFNLRMDQSPDEWWSFVRQMLRAMFSFAKKGLAANFLTSQVDWTREFGYYQNPAEALTFAMTELSRFAEIRHAYYPWEFTLLVYRIPQQLACAPAPIAWPPPHRQRPDDRAF